MSARVGCGTAWGAVRWGRDLGRVISGSATL